MISSSSAPGCIINATSPAAKSPPIHTAVTSAGDTDTSSLMPKRVARPLTASATIGRPQRVIEIHAVLNVSFVYCGDKPKFIRLMPHA